MLYQSQASFSAMNPVASISRPTTGQPAESTSRCNQQYIQTRATVDQLLICIQSVDNSAVASYSGSSRNAKISRRSWMSTAELNSNGENDKKPAKEKDTSTVPLSVLYKTHFKREEVVSNGINLNRGYIFEAPLKKCSAERDDVGATTVLWQKYIDYIVHQQREKEKIDEAIDRH
ncbi:hypothetical protein F511_08640 [Dorcoceras hygrometricum]|uniref:Uncharacterized protein n=1 Tax=Dorcoceras hygrometricum TaxID=472368 RepID=A0A2Z7ANT1_9LAMI|nr:hypothetical protein F511_08640 [Dorcoceras hygrometricum]